jgi:aminopeptidase
VIGWAGAESFAQLICDWCLEVAPGQQVLAGSTGLGEVPLTALHNAILDRGAWPLIRMTPAALGHDFYVHARPDQIDGFAPAELAEMQQVDAFVRIDAPANTAALADIDPATITRAAVARRAVQEVRLSKRWCGTIWPTPALAQLASMADGEYAAFLQRALFLDRDDPVAAWQELSARQQALVDRLTAAREIRIRAEGTDLTLDVTGRTWINSDGRRNMPSGEVFTGPHERSANGTVRFTVPTGPRGVTVTGVTLTFKDGEVVDHDAERGGDYLDQALKTDAGARFLGELGIGTNAGIDRATGHILLDEKMAGTVHLAIGRSYPETGGTNVSALHWDLICDLRDGGEILADGEPVISNGGFHTRLFTGETQTMS